MVQSHTEAGSAGTNKPQAGPGPTSPHGLSWGSDFVWVCVLAFVAQFVVHFEHLDLPAYHDAMITWDWAQELRGRLARPFVYEMDTGHPPLVAWLLAVLSWLPGATVGWMHALIWAAASLFLASVYALGRRAFGPGVGLAAAFTLALHPVVAGQSLQLNLDLFVAAFGLAGAAALASGRPVWLSVACVGATMAKLNGMMAMAPFMLWAAWHCAQLRAWRRPLVFLRAAAPFVAPFAVFALYHLLKLRATGHLFDSGEFEGGEQIALVSSLGQYARNNWHSFYMTLRPHGNAAFAVGVVLLVAALAARCLFSTPTRRRIARIFERPADADAFWRPLAPVEILAVLWLFYPTQVALQSIRSILTLMRYFMIVYPALHITLFGLVALLLARPLRRRLALAALALFLGVFLWFKGHPERVEALPTPLAEAWINPPPGVVASGEESLFFVDRMELMRDAADYMSRRYPDALIDVGWPYVHYLSDPTHGMVEAPLRTTSYAGRGASGRVEVDVLVRVGSTLAGETPVTAPRTRGFKTKKIFRDGPSWVGIWVPKRQWP